MSAPDQVFDLSTVRVRVERDDAVVTVTATNGEQSHAQDFDMLEDLRRALLGVMSLDPLPRVLVLAAEGERRFVGAAKPEMLMAADAEAGDRASRLGQENARLLDGMPIVTIAAVNGAAMGGGLEMALACDFAFASSRASFVQAEVRGGVVPGFGGSYRLPRRVGSARARWMTLTGQPIDSRTALAWGLVLDVVEPEELIPRVRKAVDEVLAAQPDAVRAAKRLLFETADMTLDAANRHERATFAATMGSPEIQVGMSKLIAARDAKTAG